MSIRKFNFWYWLADQLPNNLIYCCFLKVVAYATTGDYSSTIVSELTTMEAMKRYGDDKNIHL